MELGNILEIQQGSKEWHELRRNCIGASDFAVIAANKGYCNNLFNKSLAALINEKKNGSYKDNIYMQKGRELEPLIRKQIQKDYNLFIEPLVFQNKDIDYCIASLDGFNFNDNTIIEIKTTSKYPSEYKYFIRYYIWQLIHQYYCVFGDQIDKKCYLYIYNSITNELTKYFICKHREDNNNDFYFYYNKNLIDAIVINYKYKKWIEECKEFKAYLDSIHTAENDHKELINRFEKIENQMSSLEVEKEKIKQELISKFPEGGDMGQFKIIKKTLTDYDYERYFKENNIALNEFVKPDYKSYIAKNNIQLSDDYLLQKKSSYSFIRNKK